MPDPKTATEHIDLLSRRIDESGLSVSAFARDVLRREPRTVFRWLAGDSPIPNLVKDWLVAPDVAAWPPNEGDAP